VGVVEGNMIPKPKRVVDKRAIEAARKPWCEIDGRAAYGEPHHIVTRGANGPDHKLNLVQLCFSCHYEKIPAAGLSQEFLFYIVARREGMTVEEVESVVRQMQMGVETA
jgi:hypothetical protein